MADAPAFPNPHHLKGSILNTKMTAIVLTAPNTLIIQEHPIPVCAEGEVLIKVAYCGICGSDIGIVYNGAKVYPLILGHEFSGTVVAVGDEQGATIMGKNVTAYPVIGCGECPQCRNNDPTKCQNYGFIGSRCDGAYAQYVKVPYANVINLDGLSLLDGALIEPLAVGMHAVRRTNLGNLTHCVVIGAGTIGMMTAMACRALGAGCITLLDIDENKLKFARTLGFETVNSAVDVVSQVKDKYPFGATAVFECTGVSAVIGPAIEYVAPGASLVMVGLCKKDLCFTPSALRAIMKKEICYTGSWVSNYTKDCVSDWSLAIDAVRSGRIQPQTMIGRMIRQNDVIETIKQMHENPLHSCKQVIDYNK